MTLRAILLALAVVATHGATQDAEPTRRTKEPPAVPRRSEPSIKGLRVPRGVTDRAFVQAALRDLAGGPVVVVEEESFTLKPSRTVRFGNLRVLAQPAALPVAPWVDDTRVFSGTNVVAQVFPLGWGYR